MKSKVKFYLHGKFGQAIGPEWDLFVRTPAEGLRLIEANTRKVFAFLADEKERQTGYQILIGDQPISSEEELNCTVGKETEVHFVPVVEGAKSGVGKIVAGIILIAAVFVFQQHYLIPIALKGVAGAGALAGVSGAVSAGFISGYLAAAALSMGVALIAGGISQLIAGTPDIKGDSQENKPSYGFNGPVNTTRQGNPVPICYGKVLCGSALISLQISSKDITATLTPKDPDDYDPETGELRGGGKALATTLVTKTGYIAESPFTALGRPVQIP